MKWQWPRITRGHLFLGVVYIMWKKYFWHTMAKIKWMLVQVRAGDLKSNPNNPKKRNEAGFKRLQKLTAKYGLVFSGIVNKDLTIIDGHSRAELAVGPNEMVSVFKPSRQLTEKEYIEFNALYDLARAGDVDYQIIESVLTDQQMVDWEIDDGRVHDNGFGTQFTLPQGEKKPFQQLTFTVADDQAEQIKNALDIVRETDEYKSMETHGNENSNGNALALIIQQWKKNA